MIVIAVAAFRIWFVLTAIALISMAFNLPPKEAFVAERSLRFNHRIVAGDVTPVRFIAARRSLHPGLGRLVTSRDFAGRYVLAASGVARGAAIPFEQTSERPSLAVTEAGETIAWLALADVGTAAAASMEPGDTIDVCADDGNTCARELPIAALTCSDDGKTCSAALRIRAGAAGDFTTAQKAKPLRLFLHPKGTSQ